MKTVVLLLALLVATQAQSRGGDSSAGGGGGQVAISSGFSPGNFSISMFSDRGKVLETVTKYYSAIPGAKKTPMTNAMAWDLPDNMSAIIISSSAESEYQMNLTLPFADLRELRSGNGYTTLRFIGPLAQELYDSMQKSGLQYQAEYPNPDGTTFGYGYRDGEFGCDKSPRALSCTLQFSPKP